MKIVSSVSLKQYLRNDITFSGDVGRANDLWSTSNIERRSMRRCTRRSSFSGNRTSGLTARWAYYTTAHSTLGHSPRAVEVRPKPWLRNRIRPELLKKSSSLKLMIESVKFMDDSVKKFNSCYYLNRCTPLISVCIY